MSPDYAIFSAFQYNLLFDFLLKVYLGVQCILCLVFREFQMIYHIFTKHFTIFFLTFFLKIRKIIFERVIKIILRGFQQSFAFLRCVEAGYRGTSKGWCMYIPHKSWDIFSDTMAMTSSLVILHGINTLYIHSPTHFEIF